MDRFTTATRRHISRPGTPRYAGTAYFLGPSPRQTFALNARRPLESPAVNGYTVQLDVYNGPLDLLLYLIRRDELDIHDIPIADVTRQYCDYVACLHQIDPETAAEFLVMAATLMEIKSRMLLPQSAPEEALPAELNDPRMQLVRQLLEYKRFKDAALALTDAAALQAARWPRNPVNALAAAPASFDLDDVQVWDLVAAFNQLMVAIGRDRATHDVVLDDTPIAMHAVDIQDRLGRNGPLPFASLFAGRSRSEMIGLFLALLELIRQRRVRVEQPDGSTEIMVIAVSLEPITVGSEWDYRAPATEPDETPMAADRVPVEAPAGIMDDDPDERDELLDELAGIPTDLPIGDELARPDRTEPHE